MDFVDTSTDLIDAHSFDYDLYLKNLKEEVVENAVVVFLDESGPFHPDRIVLKNSFPCSEEQYFEKLNSFFRMVENKFNCQVVIVAHPKSNYNKLPDFFEGRKLIRKQTHHLVKNSKFVIASCSTAISVAVIYKKPIIFLALNPPLKHILDYQISRLASEFEKTPIHLTGAESIDWEKQLSVDGERYARYCVTYIKKPGSPEKPI